MIISVEKIKQDLPHLADGVIVRIVAQKEKPEIFENTDIKVIMLYNPKGERDTVYEQIGVALVLDKDMLEEHKQGRYANVIHTLIEGASPLGYFR